MSAEIFQLGHEAGVKHCEMPQKLCLCCSGSSTSLYPQLGLLPSGLSSLNSGCCWARSGRRLFLPAANISVTGESQSWWQQRDVPDKGTEWNYCDNTFQSSFCNRL